MSTSLPPCTPAEKRMASSVSQVNCAYRPTPLRARLAQPPPLSSSSSAPRMSRPTPGRTPSAPKDSVTWMPPEKEPSACAGAASATSPPRLPATAGTSTRLATPLVMPATPLTEPLCFIAPW
ncbi:MAG: hypothetical protein U1F43_19435 [Myxococcota bacterium]